MRIFSAVAAMCVVVGCQGAPPPAVCPEATACPSPTVCAEPTAAAVEPAAETKPAPVAPRLSGFYRISHATVGGKKVDPTEIMRAKIEADGKTELVYQRMSLEFDGTMVTTMIEQVMGKDEVATWCRAAATGAATYSEGTVSWPALVASAGGGSERIKDEGNSSKHSGTCKASLLGGTFKIAQDDGQITLTLISDEGAPSAAVVLVSDDKDVDLEAKTSEFAKK